MKEVMSKERLIIPCSCETPLVVLCAALGHPTGEGRGAAQANPEEGHEDGKKVRVPLPW